MIATTKINVKRELCFSPLAGTVNEQTKVRRERRERDGQIKGFRWALVERISK